MTNAAVEVVSYCEYAICDTVLGLLRHIGICQCAGGFAFPIFESFS